jgi:hypothetical protein
MVDLLVDASAPALTFGTDLFVSELPESPDEAVVLYDTGGFDPEVQYQYLRPTVQIVVRGEKGSYVATHQLAQAVAVVLNGRHNETVNDARYVGIWQEGDIAFLQYDEQHRPEFSVSFRIHRTGAA